MYLGLKVSLLRRLCNLLDFFVGISETENIFWKYIIPTILQSCAIVISVYLPLKVLKETNKANKQQIYLQNQIQSNKEIYKLLEDWKINLSKISYKFENNEDLYDTYSNLYYNISKSLMHASDEFEQEFHQLVKNTYRLLGDDITKNFEELRKTTFKQIHKMKKLLCNYNEDI